MSPSPPESLLPAEWRRVALFTATVVGLLFAASAGQFALLAAGLGEPAPVLPALRAGFREAWPWLLLTPGILWLSQRFPLVTWPWPARTTAAHLLGAATALAAVSAVHSQGADDVVFVRSIPLASAPPALSGELRPLGGGDRFRLAITHRGMFHFLNYVVIVASWQALAAHRAVRERARQSELLGRRLAEARLRALQAQLQPHFLFNTLNTIASHVRDAPEIAEEMIARLGSLLRSSLDITPLAEIPLRRELELADHYLAIEQVRFGERLVVQRAIEEDALGCPVPALLLQPLLENAVRHGIETRPGPGLIRLTGEVRDGNLTLRVCDNGAGLGSEPRRAEGVGLPNARARLQEMYGEDSTLELTALPTGGTEVVVRLPARSPTASP